MVHNDLKKIITILLLGCLCLNMTGYRIVFQIRKATLKMAMKRMLRRQANNQDELCMEFPLSPGSGSGNPEWENDHEFSLDGKMYDVIEKKIAGDKMLVRCISDDNETELIRKYQQVLEKHFSTSAKKRSASLLQLVISPYTVPASIITSIFVLPVHKQFPVLHCNLPIACREVITPPPRFL